ncbi:HXXEE domain-containing protein [Bacillus pseudomycoides]|uniref:HXXEE domain-containing protein n=1 Tax=Bacillus pseudomycoides TaxID=64104 RepID=UPI000BEC5CE0|nr:HXXEE domain-containing protein [Bacillus pseudomycoides]PDZ08525.1 HXXEE domain-containing protein [Bacillus pseudomycoides]PEM34914.1 HXXEE domain-containing protein [Bacillus pseudomycoides]PFW88455.1 HXXEE domain-containing protein [Bacillus pseudomycoides]PFX37542.1 HXXEE domain-containing protein [Bacillus pseudomycoides]
MLERFKTWSNSTLYIWLIPILFAFHNAEEYYFFPEMKYFQPIRMEENAGQKQYFFIALCLLTSIVFLLVCIHSIFKKKVTLYILLVIQAMIFMNGLFHITGAILTERYVPGLVTAVIFIIPFSFFWFRKGIRNDWWELKHVIVSCIAGVLLLFPVIVGILLFSKMIVS